MPPLRTRGQRAGLTRADVVRAAVEITHDPTASRLSMRTVAQRLGVAPNALYSYVDGKHGLVDAVLDDLLHQIPAPGPAGDPRAEIRGCMLTTFDVLLAARDLIPLYLSRHGSRGPRATELGQALEVLLRRLGVPESRARLVVRVLVLQTIGIAAQAASDDGVLPVAELRATLAMSIDWVVDGASRPDSATVLA